ncbi:hypothetical protein PMIN03_005469 [Paraphaeosphaeria minitans]
MLRLVKFLEYVDDPGIENGRCMGTGGLVLGRVLDERNGNVFDQGAEIGWV